MNRVPLWLALRTALLGQRGLAPADVTAAHAIARWGALGVLLLALAGCTPKKDAIRADAEWKAPLIQCQQGKTPPIPDLPPMWFLEGPAWAAQVLGIAIEERRLRGLEHACLDEHRKKGLIR